MISTHAPPAPQSDAPFSALVVANDRIQRQAITAWLRHMGAGTIHNAATIAEARACILTTKPGDLAIIDLEAPDGTGIELVSELHDHGWPHIVVLATAGNLPAIPPAFHAGAHAYLLKSPSPRTNITPATRANPYETPGELSDREIAVLKLVADGKSNKEIGEKLHLSPYTIKTRLSRIGQKLGTSNRVRMITLALRAGIIH
jgi:DNA-binding NarL/FixJ family response regulator